MASAIRSFAGKTSCGVASKASSSGIPKSLRKVAVSSANTGYPRSYLMLLRSFIEHSAYFDNKTIYEYS
jgi:hypothetical protein